MSKVVVFNQPGDADVLTIQDMPVLAPRADEVQIRVRAIGINRAEIMYRTGQYIYQPKFPARLGYEASGVVESVGDNVREFAPGDSVSVIPAFSFHEYGMYGEVVNAPAVFSKQCPTVTADFCHWLRSGQRFVGHIKAVIQLFAGEIRPNGQFMVVEREGGLRISDVVLHLHILRRLAVINVLRTAFFIVYVVGRCNGVVGIPAGMR